MEAKKTLPWDVQYTGSRPPTSDTTRRALALSTWSMVMMWPPSWTDSTAEDWVWAAKCSRKGRAAPVISQPRLTRQPNSNSRRPRA